MPARSDSGAAIAPAPPAPASDDAWDPALIEERLTLLSVLQELTVATLDLFDPRRSIDLFLDRLAARLGCAFALCIETDPETGAGKTRLQGSTGLSSASRGLPLDPPGGPGARRGPGVLVTTLDGGSFWLPFPELQRSGLTRWSFVCSDCRDPASQAIVHLLLFFHGEPGLPPIYRKLVERLAETLRIALAHRHLNEQSIEHERRLLEQKTLLECQSEASMDGILLVSPDGRVLSFNRRFAQMWAVPEEAMAGLGGEDSHDELQLADGRILERHSAPLRSAGGQSFGRGIYFRDVTERRRAEREIRRLNEELGRRVEELAVANRDLGDNLRRLQETQDQLLQAGKMAAIGTLVAGLSHELNNPIGIILGYAQSLLAQSSADQPSWQALSAIERQAARCTHLIKALLDFSRSKAAGREPTAPAALLERILDLAGAQARRRGVRLSLVATGALPDVPVCAAEIESALLNVVNNALDATPAGGAVELAAERRPAGGGDGVDLRITDSGCGIPRDLLPRVFDPFFTTKPVGQGTGLGLSLARRIAESHGGRIHIESELGHGTTVRIWLPLKAAEPPAAAARRAGQPGEREG